MVEKFLSVADEFRRLLKNHDATLPEKALQKIINIKDLERDKNNEQEIDVRLLREEINVIAKSKAENSDEIVQLQKEFEVQKHELHQLLASKKQLQSQKESHVQEKEGITTQLKKDRNELGKCILSMENNIKSCKDVLGLDFKKHDDDTITFIYRHVFLNNPNRTCSFDLQIKEGIYQVLRCDPDVENVNELLTALNKSNDFRLFILKMRNLFLSREINCEVSASAR